jgi:hypothetical protein
MSETVPEARTKRFQMEMPPKSVERLNRLREITESSSYTEVIRNALQIYEALIDETQKGGKVYVETGEGRQQLMVFSS